MNLKEMGAAIRAARKEKRLTLQEVGEAIGVTPQAVSNYEKGEREPRDEIKLRLANFYQLPVSIFFTQGVNEAFTAEGLKHEKM